MVVYLQVMNEWITKLRTANLPWQLYKWPGISTSRVRIYDLKCIFEKKYVTSRHFVFIFNSEIYISVLGNSQIGKIRVPKFFFFF